MTHRDNLFGGSVAEVYETAMVPMIFEPYAADLVSRLAASPVTDVLEIGAGTGALTRRLAAVLPSATTLVAVDLNPAMLERAAAIVGTTRAIEWRQADVANLPFADGTFDLVVGQFVAMFFPDKPRAFSEVRRVLRPGGRFIFSVWGPLAENGFAETVDSALAERFAADPPRFMARVPHGYYDRDSIQRDLTAGGFERPARFDSVMATSRVPSAQTAAMAFCHGTPLRTEIEARDAGGLEGATAAVASALASRFGDGPIEAPMEARLITIER